MEEIELFGGPIYMDDRLELASLAKSLIKGPSVWSGFQVLGPGPKCSVQGRSARSRAQWLILVLNLRPKYFLQDFLLTFIEKCPLQKVSSPSLTTQYLERGAKAIRA